MFNQSYGIRITPLVINILESGYTHMHTNFVDESNNKKPGALAKGQCTPGLKIYTGFIVQILAWEVLKPKMLFLKSLKR